MWGAVPLPMGFSPGTASCSRARVSAFSPAMYRMSASRVAAPARTAAAKAAIWAVASVPERRPSSCPPPRIRGGSFSPRRMYKAPIPLGAWILCPLTVSRSTPSSAGVKGIFKKPCTPSQ